MSNYIYDNTALFFPKTNLAPLPGGADPTKYVQDTDWNTLNQAVTDIKGVLRGAVWYGLDDQISDPAPAGISAYLWMSTTGALNLKNGLSNATLVQSTRTISTGAGLSGGGDLSTNRTISLASIPIGTTIGSGTQGSLLFAGTSGALAQDNVNLFWNSATNRLGIGTNSPGFSLAVHDGTAANTNDVLEIRNKSNSGYSTIWFTDSAGTERAHFGYANATAPITFLRGFAYYFTTNSTIFTFSDAVGRAIDVSPVSGSVGIEFANGSSYTVSSSNKGKIRYNTTGQKFQVSTNGGAYVDLTTGAVMAIGNTVTSATSGSVLFAGSSSALAQDNANLFWDATNKKLSVGASTFMDNTGIGGATAPSLQVKGQSDISQIASVAFGASALASVAGIRGRGTQSSPTAVQTGDVLMAFHGSGQYDSTVNHISTSSQVLFSASENWNSGARGGRISWLTVPNGGTNLLERFSVENDGGLALQNSNSAAVSAASTGRLRYSTTNQRFQASVNTGAFSDIVTRDYISVDRKSASGAADLTTDTTFVSGTGTALTLAAGTKDGQIKNFVITGGTGTVTPASMANGSVLTWSSAPANTRLVWNATGATWHVFGTPYNVVVS